MRTILASLAAPALIGAALIAPAAASAQAAPPQRPAAQEANGIIAILIGFTPPIGTNHGSVRP